MNIVAITQHRDLAERVRAAFKPGGHQLSVMADPLQALAGEALGEAQLLIVDAAGEPIDGIRFSELLRRDSRLLFRSVPIFLVYDQPLADIDPNLLLDLEVDGWLHADDGPQRILSVLGPAVDGHLPPREVEPVPLLAAGLASAVACEIAPLVKPHGFGLQACLTRDLVRRQEEFQAPILLLGVDPSGEEALAALQQLREHRLAPYTILVGPLPEEELQRKLLHAGGMDWLTPPLAAPLLLHRCRRGLEWLHLKRVQCEFHTQIRGMHEQRLLLETEAASLRSEVLTDPLTELLNRRAFQQNLDLAINQWVRHRRPFVLIIGDIDYFKLINDRFGHLIGDEVLKVLAERIRASLRRSDLAFRIGGEEFAIILMETGLQAGAEVADKLRRRIDENPIHLETGQSIFPTVSFGVGVPGDDDANSLCAAVDEALYIAKHKGRNRIEVVKEKAHARE